jgi:hypothetical protein
MECVYCEVGTDFLKMVWKVGRVFRSTPSLIHLQGLIFEKVQGKFTNMQNVYLFPIFQLTFCREVPFLTFVDFPDTNRKVKGM